MSFENNNFQVVKKTRLPKGEFSLSCNVSAEGEIAKVFAVSLNAYCENQEITNGTVSYSGHVDVCMIYQLETGEVGSAFSSCPFSSKFEDESITSGERAMINLKVIDHSIDAVSGSDATIGMVIEQSGLLVQNAEVRSITSNDESVCLREEEVSVIRFIGSVSASAVETAQHSTREKVKKILGSEASVIIKEAEAGVNFVSVSGDVVTKVLYLDENDKFENVQIYDSFKEEIEIEGVTRDSLIEATSAINNSCVKIEVEDDDKGSRITATVPFELTAYAFEETSLNMVVDLYSTESDMEISTESFNMTKPLAMECVEGKVDGSLTIDDEQPRVDKILFTFGSAAQVTNTYVEGGEIFIEGIAKTTVVYLNDELGSFNAVEIEVPFQISDKTKATENSMLLTNAILTDVDVAVKRGREIFFDGKVRAIVAIGDDEVSAAISEAREGDAYLDRDCAMELVFAKEGATLWDIAKMNKVRESLIAEQNPNIIFPLQENSDLVIFYQSK